MDRPKIAFRKLEAIIPYVVLASLLLSLIAIPFYLRGINNSLDEIAEQMRQSNVIQSEKAMAELSGFVSAPMARAPASVSNGAAPAARPQAQAAQASPEQPAPNEYSPMRSAPKQVAPARRAEQAAPTSEDVDALVAKHGLLK